MWQHDPFFKVRPQSYGLHKSYIEDISRTYKQNLQPLPTRDKHAFERAYQYRQQEKEQIAQREQELINNANQYQDYASKLYSLCEQSIAENSKLKAELDGYTRANDDSTHGNASVPEQRLESTCENSAEAGHDAQEEPTPPSTSADAS